MGNLHDGHLSLVNLAKQHADVVVVSIFVNPTQFGAGEDFASYPRTLDDDCQNLPKLAWRWFCPKCGRDVPCLSAQCSNPIRQHQQDIMWSDTPTHFDGVGLVVSKLFNIVRPDVAVFGKRLPATCHHLPIGARIKF